MRPSDRQSARGGPGRSLQILLDHGDPPFDIAGTLAIAETLFRCFCNNNIFLLKRAYGHVIWLSTYRPSAALTQQILWAFIY